jgi:hypothetical protein
MLKKLKQLFKSLFKAPSKPQDANVELFGSQAYVKVGDYDGKVHILSQYQLDKRTHFKPGEQYRVGEGIATVHADKSSMYMALLKTEDKYFLKVLYKTMRGEDLMMMSPQELETLRLTEWLSKRKAKEGRIKKIIGRTFGKLLKGEPGFGVRGNSIDSLSAKYPPPMPEQPKKEATQVKEDIKEKIK